MLIYLDAKSARALGGLLSSEICTPAPSFYGYHDTFENIINQLDEGLKNYEKE